MTLGAAFLSFVTSVGPASLAATAPPEQPLAPPAAAPSEIAAPPAASSALGNILAFLAVSVPAAEMAAASSAEDAGAPTPEQLAFAFQDAAPPGPAPTPDIIAAPTPEQLVLAFQDAAPAGEPAQAPAEGAAPAETTGAPAVATATQPNERGEPPPTPLDQELIEGRRRPDIEREHPDAIEQVNIGAIRSPPPEAFPADHIPVPDRWRLIQSLGVVQEHWWDPYNQNTYKGDRPICIPTAEEQERRREAGQPRCATPRFLGLQSRDWFFAINAVSDTVVEPRSFPIPAVLQTSERPDQNDIFGRSNSLVLAQTLVFSAALIKGSTAYKPPDVEWRITLAANASYVDVPERRVLDVRPSVSSNRFDYALGVQEAFLDYHLGNTSHRYDFYSFRLGVQTFQFDFRGFLFSDQQLGFRLFGNRDNNRFQFNLAAIWRLEKDTNSGLNNILQTPRRDWILHANVFRQDFPVVNITSELSLTWNINRERNDIEVDDNGFPVRPELIGNLNGRNYDAFYIGYNADGHIGRLNLTASAYGVFGSDRDNIFTGREARIQAFFAAFEPSFDLDWARVRGAALFASGDGNPYDNVQRGFDNIFENPIFAGADTSYWVRQTIPFIGGARAVSLQGRNGILNNLRSSKEQGQSNFVNPGTMLLGAGADFDLLPTFRISANVNHLWFHRTEVLQALRMQGTVRRDIGWDLSAAAIWRPHAIQNVVFRVSGALLQPGTGFRDIFTTDTRDSRYYSVLFNAILSY